MFSKQTILQYISFLRRYILFVFISIVLLHFLKDTFYQYYLALISAALVCSIFVYHEVKILEVKLINNVAIIWLVYCFSLLLIILISILYIDRFDLTPYEILMAFGKLFINPTIVLLTFFLAKDRDDYKKLLAIFSFIILLAVLSIILQIIYGHIPFFGKSYYHEARFGLEGFSSITGSVNSYGISFHLAALFIFFSKNINNFLKSLLIFIMFTGANLALSKSGLINIALTTCIMSLFIFHSKNWQIFLGLLILFIISFLFIDVFSASFIGLLINTTGIEFLPNTLNQENYIPLYENMYERISLRWGAPTDMLIKDYIFGIGIYAASGVLGIMNPVTSHNSFIDLYFMGGLFSISSLVLLLITIQKSLIKIYFSSNSKDTLALIFFSANSLLILNAIFFNGALFHPIISFSFCLSIAYILKIMLKTDDFYG